MYTTHLGMQTAGMRVRGEEEGAGAAKEEGVRHVSDAASGGRGGNTHRPWLANRK